MRNALGRIPSFFLRYLLVSLLLGIFFWPGYFLAFHLVFSFWPQYLKPADDTDPSSYSSKIIECSWDSDEHVWVCMRVRIDKSTPNDFNTYKKVCSFTLHAYLYTYLLFFFFQFFYHFSLHNRNNASFWAKQVMRSIRDNITEDVLLNEIYEIIRLPMYADRIRSESKAQQHANAARRKWWTEWGMVIVFRVSRTWITPLLDCWWRVLCWFTWLK